MISLDRRLFTAGEVTERHKKYADCAGALDVIVFAPNQSALEWTSNFRVYSTGSTKFFHYQKAYQLAARLFVQNKYELVVTQEFASPVGARLKAKFGTPLLVSIHSMFFTSKWLGLDPLKWFLYICIKKAIKIADAFRVVNSNIAERLDKWGIGKPVLVAPTPVAIKDFFTPDKKTNPIPVILFVGRLSTEKNVAMLIEAVKELKVAAVLKIAGQGPQEGKLKNLARDAKQIEFLGFKTHEELPPIYREADIFVLPSNTESFGWALLEAAAARCAIVATRTPGAINIIRNGENGLLVYIGGKAELRKTLERLIASPDLRSRLGGKAQEEARLYDSEKAIPRIVNFWKDIAKTA